MPSTAERRGVGAHVRDAALPAGLCALLWSVLTEGAIGSWLVGAPVVLGCAMAASLLRPYRPRRVRLRAAVAFVPFFIWRSLGGGVDVARRAMGWKLDIAPALLTYRLQLPAEGPARVVFVNVLSLLPGTLAADLEGSVVRVHTLARLDDMDGLRRLEAHVAALFGHPLPEAGR